MLLGFKEEEPTPQHKEHSPPITDQNTTAVSGHDGGKPHGYVPHHATQGRSGPSPHETSQGIAAVPDPGSGDVAEPLTVGELTPATDHSNVANFDPKGGDPQSLATTDNTNNTKYLSSPFGKIGGQTNRL